MMMLVYVNEVLFSPIHERIKIELTNTMTEHNYSEQSMEIAMVLSHIHVRVGRAAESHIRERQIYVARSLTRHIQNYTHIPIWVYKTEQNNTVAPNKPRRYIFLKFNAKRMRI